MTDKVVEIVERRQQARGTKEPEFWPAQVDIRLSRIEVMITRLEWQIWLIVCGGAGILILEVIEAFRAV